MEYRSAAHNVTAEQLVGFFEGWPAPPSPDQHLALLLSSSHVVLALEADAVVGFVTAISDGMLSAYIPLLEVRREWRGRGIGTELVRRTLDAVRNLYMVDVVCDPDLVPFYERFGMVPLVGMALRNRPAAGRG